MNASWTKYLPAFIRQKLEGRHSLQNIIGNSGWLFADRLFRSGAGFFVNIWITRYLGPEQFGMLSYAMAFAALFSPLVSLGLNDIIVRDIVHDPSCTDETLGSALAITMTGGVLSFAAAIGSATILLKSDSQINWLVGIIAAGAFFQPFNVIECWFNSQVQGRYIVFAKNIAFIVSSAIKIALILNGATMITFAWVATIEVALCAFGMIVVFQSKGRPISSLRVTLKRSTSLLKDSWPLALSLLGTIIYQRIDQVMLGDMVGNREVGIYSVAVRLSEVWVFIPSVVYWSVFPSIIKARQISDELFYERLQKYYNLVALLAYAIAIPITICSQWLVDSLFGEAYSRAGSMVAWLIWGHLFMSLEMASCAFLAAMKWYKIYFISFISGCIVNVGLCYILLPRYGGMGAVIASLAAYWVAGHGYCFLFRPTFKTGHMITKAMIYPKIW
ncbi:MAG: flippase [Desulfuromonadaceae bacterium]|nr:flippase [Desulfuromonadaceae bacterium]MDD5106899.1 flippase [Desulfuromonadaceae bacterium]